jgi:hypothetical protein
VFTDDRSKRVVDIIYAAKPVSLLSVSAVFSDALLAKVSRDFGD